MIRYLLHFLKRKMLQRKNFVTIYSHRASLIARYGYRTLIAKGTYIGDEVSIGDYSYVNCNSSLEHCSVGSFCSISSEVIIGPHEHFIKGVSTHPFLLEPFYGFRSHRSSASEIKRVEIGSDVWIGIRVIIKQGVSIGHGSIIGAGSLVLKDIPPYEIWGGVPARKIRDRFSPEVTKKILDTRWWSWNQEIIMSLIDDFNHPEQWLEKVVHIKKYSESVDF